jgi:hypothetical protein
MKDIRCSIPLFCCCCTILQALILSQPLTCLLLRDKR